MQLQRNKVYTYHYSLSPQKQRKATGSRLIILKNPINKLQSPISWQSDLFTEQPILKPHPSEKAKNIARGISPFKVPGDSRTVLISQIDGNKFTFPSIGSPVMSVIRLKEAMRDRDWVIKARESLSRELSELINCSNGVEIEIPQGCFKYYLGKGNNMTLIKQCFNSRWWWTEDSAKSANVIWTQTISKGFFENLEGQVKPPKELDSNSLNKSVRCNVYYESDTLEEKQVDISPLNYDLITLSSSYIGFSDRRIIDPLSVHSHNKLEFNSAISDKKNLFFTMKKYYSALGENVFGYLPITFHIKNGENDPEFLSFSEKFFGDQEKKSVWIIKPGENTNRGNGIVICDSLLKIKEEIKSNPFPETGDHTYIIQKYIENPFLVNKRKFDIRLYTLITSTNGIAQAYFYQEGYIRTSSKDYNRKAIDNKFIHLTNDAVQKKADDYGKFENGNKMSYKDFQKYLDNKRIPKNFFYDILPNIKKIVLDTIKASFLDLDKRKRTHTFEIFGYDFLLDSDLRPWLLEINTNPCLELSSTILARIIPAMVENAFKIAVDPIFPEPLHSPKKAQASLFQDLVPENRFELIFHEAIDGKALLEDLKSRGTLENFVRPCND
ncbi:hypothetical protein SteCoe_34156 [Stentor coeruleus]|uniref:Tubulin--tyrosine ligase-like protein 9 n=1 Tax=Stentor coeruleus TaxID=5963 RepID=A0A1R2AVI6_9CILI|nr:hypothetical protein SteCoe_34156 [Stentor coeruleus]